MENINKPKYNLMAFIIPKILQKEFKFACLKQNRSMSEVIRDLMEDYIHEVQEDEQKNMA